MGRSYRSGPGCNCSCKKNTIVYDLYKMSRRILYIINPISGTGGQKGLKGLIEKSAESKGIPFFFFPSVASGDYSYLRSIIKDKGVSDVVIAGGDGTISQVVGSLMDLPLDFGIIPCGSGNGLAYTLKIPKHPGKALDIILNGKPKFIDGFTVNGRFACMLGGLGFDA